MTDREKVYKKQLRKVMTDFVSKYGQNIAICSYGPADSIEYAVFQFYTSYGDVHAVQVYPLDEVKDIKKIMFTCGLAVDNASKLIKIKEA